MKDAVLLLNPDKMTLLKDVAFAKKIFTAEIETADWDRNN